MTGLGCGLRERFDFVTSATPPVDPVTTETLPARDRAAAARFLRHHSGGSAPPGDRPLRHRPEKSPAPPRHRPELFVQRPFHVAAVLESEFDTLGIRRR